MIQSIFIVSNQDIRATTKDLLFFDMIKVSKEDDFTGKPKLLLYDQIIIDDICVFKTLWHIKILPWIIF